MLRHYTVACEVQSASISQNQVYTWKNLIIKTFSVFIPPTKHVL